MKKIIAAGSLVLASLGYIFYRNTQTDTPIQRSTGGATSETSSTAALQNRARVGQNGASASGATTSSGSSMVGSGGMMNGGGTTGQGMCAPKTYTGTAEPALYGYVQVEATVKCGTLVDVAFLQYPTDRKTSAQLSARAQETLRSEAIAAQSAQVDVVSGATETSDAFMRSLASALTQAGL